MYKTLKMLVLATLLFSMESDAAPVDVRKACHGLGRGVLVAALIITVSLAENAPMFKAGVDSDSGPRCGEGVFTGNGEIICFKGGQRCQVNPIMGSEGEVLGVQTVCPGGDISVQLNEVGPVEGGFAL